ncbi:hypothetical protein [Solibacillus sp. R5-41]|uniref:hypothetical protein n=1 Tax=Solibacillus sp. R5-41 TaxID=2048654 RepID=UPI0020A34016|nr:hypothetical protein [Solibacillus sp. R5-41]
MKLGLILALSYHPKLLLLNEPTSGLDPIVRDEVLELLQQFMENDEHAITSFANLPSQSLNKQSYKKTNQSLAKNSDSLFIHFLDQ